MSGTGLKDKLHIAFFKGDSSAGCTLLGIASLSDIHYGLIHIGDAVNDTPVMDAVRSNSGEMTFTLEAGGYAALRLVVWLDGVTMKNDHGSKNMLFSLTFNGEGI